MATLERSLRDRSSDPVMNDTFFAIVAASTGEIWQTQMVDFLIAAVNIKN